MARPIRVLEVLEATAGGTRRHLREVLAALRGPQFQVDVACAIRRDLSFREDVDADDIDALSLAIRVFDTDPRFDLDDSGQTDEEDLTYLVENILGTKRGDTNLNGKVDFNDFLALSARFGLVAGWAGGNSDTDTTVSFNDFLALSANFGFQREQLAARLVDAAFFIDSD